MTTEKSTGLTDWARPYYQASTESPFLFYVIFGATADNFAISRNNYLCDGIPDSLEILAYGPDNHPEVIDNFRTANLQVLEDDAGLIAEIARQTHCVIIKGHIQNSENLNYFRNTIGLLTFLLDNGGVAIFDTLSLSWWSKSRWMAEIFQPATPQPNSHVVILTSAENDDANTLWFHTRGLLKFGRPDLSIHNVPSHYHSAVIEMFNRFIGFQAFGGMIEQGQEIRMNSLPDNMYCLHSGHYDDPDFNNVHIEIKWPEIY